MFNELPSLVYVDTSQVQRFTTPRMHVRSGVKHSVPFVCLSAKQNDILWCNDSYTRHSQSKSSYLGTCIPEVAEAIVFRSISSSF